MIEYLDIENVSSIKSVTGEATADVLKQEQLADVTLAAPWRMASQGKGNYFIKEGLLYRTEKRFGQTIKAVCIPQGRRPEVLRYFTYGS